MYCLDITWPIARLDEAAARLALHAGLIVAPSAEAFAISNLADHSEDGLSRWLTVRLAALGLEVESVETTYPEVETFLRHAGPALVRIGGASATYLALLRGNRNTVTIIGTDGRLHRLPLAQARDALCGGFEAAARPAIDEITHSLALAPKRQQRIQQALLREQLRDVRMRGSWLVRLAPTASLWGHLRRTRLLPLIGWMIVAFAIEQAILAGAWTAIGQTALTGSLAWSSTGVWLLLLLTAIPFQILSAWTQNRFEINAGSLFREQLLAGILRLAPDQIRHQGAGSFLSRVMEAEAFEALALGGGFLAIMALLQIGLAMVILTFGSGGGLHTLSLIIWTGIAAALVFRYARQAREWIETYRAMTADLVERMAGQRTRLAQEDRTNWHDEEDRALNRYTELSTRLDAASASLPAIIYRGWLIIGVIGLVPAFLNSYTNPISLGIGVGGLLLAGQAFMALMNSSVSVIAAWLAWGQIAPLLRATRQTSNEQMSRNNQLWAATAQHSQPLLIGRDVSFRYHERMRPTIQQCNFIINYGDRILLKGASGSGKSTLAAILAGLRQPQAGLLLLHGIDRQTMGELEWCRRIVVAPQFHENHLLTETFAFNLLMGRGWPPTAEDLRDAERVCAALGLDDLLARMPAGMQQMIGEGGWQLSHGERSRLFLARALLQRADLIILDESFGALDPEHLQQALTYTRQMAPTLLVIAHP